MDRRQTAVQIIATLVTALLAAIVVIGLVSTRMGRDSRFAPAASEAVTSAHAHDYGAPSKDLNLLYVHDADDPNWLIGLDWSGTPRATVKLQPPQTGALMAPDGQSFAVGLNAKGGNWQFLNGVGKPIAEPRTLAGALLPIWADDNKHVCATSLDQQTLAWSLWTDLPGETPKRVAVLAAGASPGESSVRVLACSFKSDTAVLERLTQAWPWERWLIRLSDGGVLLDQKRSGIDLSESVASPDATLLAENSSRSTGQGDAGAPSTLIVRATDGAVVAKLDPSMDVLAFDGDGGAVLVTLTPWLGASIHLGIVNLASSRLVWQDNTNPNFFGQFIAEPQGGSFAIAYPTTSIYPSPSIIVIVDAAGNFTTLDQPYIPAW